MSQTITAANTTTDPTATPSVTAVADNDIGNAANLNSPLLPILNFIAWIRSQMVRLNNGGARITNVGAPTTAGDATVYPLTNAQQSFGTPSALTDVATRGYVDGRTLGSTAYAFLFNMGSAAMSAIRGDTTGVTATFDGMGVAHLTDARVTASSLVLVTPATSTAGRATGDATTGRVNLWTFDASGAASNMMVQVLVII